MIRDEFKDKKKVTSRESRKKKTQGERNYYVTQIPKIKDLIKSIGLSTILTDIFLAIAYALVSLAYYASRGTENEYGITKYIIWSVVVGVVAIWTLVWYIAIRPSLNRKADRYKRELEKLNASSLSKVAASRKIYGDAYIQELKRDRDDALARNLEKKQEVLPNETNQSQEDDKKE